MSLITYNSIYIFEKTQPFRARQSPNPILDTVWLRAQSNPLPCPPQHGLWLCMGLHPRCSDSQYFFAKFAPCIAVWTCTTNSSHPLNGLLWFNSLFSRTAWVSRYQKGKTSLDLNEVRHGGVWGCSGISWTICKQSAPRSRQTTTPTRRHSIFYRPGVLPDAQPTVSEHWRYKQIHSNKFVTNRRHIEVSQRSVNMRVLNYVHDECITRA